MVFRWEPPSCAPGVPAARSLRSTRMVRSPPPKGPSLVVEDEPTEIRRSANDPPPSELSNLASVAEVGGAVLDLDDPTREMSILPNIDTTEDPALDTSPR